MDVSIVFPLKMVDLSIVFPLKMVDLSIVFPLKMVDLSIVLDVSVPAMDVIAGRTTIEKRGFSVTPMQIREVGTAMFPKGADDLIWPLTGLNLQGLKGSSYTVFHPLHLLEDAGAKRLETKQRQVPSKKCPKLKICG